MNSQKKKIFKYVLKLKAFESVSCILPHFIELNVDSPEEARKIKERLIKLTKKYFFVTDYQSTVRGRSEQFEDSFDLKHLEPYPFNEVQTLTVDAFEEFIYNLQV